jgi:hypothetical protein
MTIQVELNSEIEAQLVAEARVRGIPLERVAERLLQEALASRSGPQGNLTLEEFHAMLNALSAGSEGLPNLPTESFTRESFYEDRAQMAGTPYLVDRNVLITSLSNSTGTLSNTRPNLTKRNDCIIVPWLTV